MEIISIIVGAILTLLGMFFGYITAKSLQDREFAKQEKEQKALVKNLLNILYEDLNSYYQKLFAQPNGYYYTQIRSIVLNHKPFLMENKNAMWPLLVQNRIFGMHRSVFISINDVCDILRSLNRQIEILTPHSHLLDETKEDVRIFKDTIAAIRRSYGPSNIASEINFENTELSKNLKNIIKEI